MGDIENKKHKIYWMILTLLVIIVGIAIGIYSNRTQVFAKGTIVGGLNIEGMTREKASKVLNDFVDTQITKPRTTYADNANYKFITTLTNLGYTKADIDELLQGILTKQNSYRKRHLWNTITKDNNSIIVYSKYLLNSPSADALFVRLKDIFDNTQAIGIDNKLASKKLTYDDYELEKYCNRFSIVDLSLFRFDLPSTVFNK